MFDKVAAAVYSFDAYKAGASMTIDELMTITQAAEYLGVTRQAVHLMTKQGYGQRVGSIWLFTREELERWKATPRHAGGRPKAGAGTLPPTHPA